MSNMTLCLTIGDPTGIGPEITAKFLNSHLKQFPHCRFLVIGATQALEQVASQLGFTLPQTDQVSYLPVDGSLPGEIAYLALDQSVQLIAAGQANALVTGPISKENLEQAGIMAKGHTEILEVLARKLNPATKAKAQMLFTYRNFRMLLLTRHVPLNRVSQTLQSLNVRHVLESLYQFLTEQMDISIPRIALMGLNPHAGEVGGMEEALILEPVLQHLNKETRAIWEGPFAADALFREFDINHIPYDAYVSCYHDQGLIAMKLIGGFKAVNVTIGLPFIRTSVSHGTAPDIVGRGIAKTDSLVAAVEEATNLVRVRQTHPNHADEVVLTNPNKH